MILHNNLHMKWANLYQSPKRIIMNMYRKNAYVYFWPIKSMWKRNEVCMLAGAIPRASSTPIKNACLLTLHWCYEVLFPDLRWQGDGFVELSPSTHICANLQDNTSALCVYCLTVHQVNDHTFGTIMWGLRSAVFYSRSSWEVRPHYFMVTQSRLTLVLTSMSSSSCLLSCRCISTSPSLINLTAEL